jgi:microcystin-dependent protein
MGGIMTLSDTARSITTMLLTGFLGLALIATADGVSRINGQQIAYGSITDAHVAANAAIAASKLDPALATQAWVIAHGAANPTGMIIMMGGATPSGYVPCDGATYDGTTSIYQPLWSVIRDTYGGSQSAFKVPDLRGRAPFGEGAGSGLSQREMGANGGEERHTLTIGEMPAHTHGIQFWGTSGGNYGLVDSNNTGSSGYNSTQGTGGSAPHNTMPPFLIVRYAIKL